MANIQHLEVAAGEDRTLTLHARNADNESINLSGQTVAVFVGRDPQYPNNAESLIILEGTLTDPAEGAFTVTVPASVTRYAGGDYEYVARSFNSNINVLSTVCRGRFRIVPTLVTL